MKPNYLTGFEVDPRKTVPANTASPIDKAEDGPDIDKAEDNVRELIRLRKQMHQLRCELVNSKLELDLTNRDLMMSRAEHDELRLKYKSLQQTEKITSGELLEERRKSDELSKQVKAMSQNLMSIMGHHEAGGGVKDISGLQKRCFKLVQQNTVLTMQSRLLRRQKGWAEAKAKVLQDEVTGVYLGTYGGPKTDNELEASAQKEFAQRDIAAANGTEQRDGAQINKLLLPVAYKHKEAVVDFCTHVTHTCGNDVLGFLASSRVFSEGIRNECLSGLGREYYAHWRQVRQLPLVMKAAERVVHLGDYLHAFEGFSKELSELLGCADAKLWVADQFKGCLWTCVRYNEAPRTIELQIPKTGDPEDLAGKGLVVAAAAERKILGVPDAGNDPRFNEATDMVAGTAARSMLCVPICQNKQVKVVLQAMNKLKEPDFDVNHDSKVLRLFGRVSMEVLQVCQTNTSQSAFTKRKDSLLQLFNDFVPCQTAPQLLNAVETGLHELFLSQHATLHVVHSRSGPVDQQGTALLQASNGNGNGKGVNARRRSTVVNRVETQGLIGIVGNVVKHMRNFAFSHEQKAKSPWDAEVDADIPENTILHTVPIMDTTGVCAVCQFLCPERERSNISDDGTFKPDNVHHMRLLGILLKFVQKHLSIVDANNIHDNGLANFQEQMKLGLIPGLDSAGNPFTQGGDESESALSSSGDEREVQDDIDDSDLDDRGASKEVPSGGVAAMRARRGSQF